MPRAGLTTAEVVRVGAALADEQGIDAVSLATVAGRLDVKPPALYRHIEGIGDLRHRIATLAMEELADALRDALQGRAATDAMAALLGTVRTYVRDHPGRYAATTGEPLGGSDDPLHQAASRVIGSLRAALVGYQLPDADLDHAIRVLRCLVHGYASLAAADGFQWPADPERTLDWMVDFVDAGLRGQAAHST